MKKRKKIGVIAILMLGMIFQQIIVFASEPVSSYFPQLAMPAGKMGLPSNVSGVDSYIEIPIYDNGVEVEQVTASLYKEYINGNIKYVLDGKASFKVKGYAYKNKNSGDTILGVMIGYYGYDSPNDPGQEPKWREEFIEAVKVTGCAASETVEACKALMEANKYSLKIDSITYQDSTQDARVLPVVSSYQNGGFIGAWKDRPTTAHVAFVTFSNEEAIAKVKLQTIYRPYGESSAASSDVSAVELKKSRQTENVNINKIKAARGAAVAINLTGANLQGAKYAIVKTGPSSAAPMLPYMNTAKWEDLDEFSLRKSEWQKAYPNMNLDKKGYIATQHYTFSGKNDETKDMISNHKIDELCTAINEAPIYQMAKTDSNKAYDTQPDKAAFFECQPNSKADEGQGEAVKFNGYIVPDKTGDYSLGIRLYGEAYGVISVEGKEVVFAKESNNASSNSKNHVANVAGTIVHLEANTPYPVYIEWYDGSNQNEQGMIPCYKLSSASEYEDIPSSWFYPERVDGSASAEKDSALEVSGSGKAVLPLEQGEYYVILKLQGNAGEDYETSYGPVEIMADPLITADGKDKNKIVPASISNVYWEMKYGEKSKEITYKLDISRLMADRFEGKNPIASYDLTKAAVNIEDEDGRIDKAYYTVSRSGSNIIAITFASDYQVEADTTHKISVFIPTKMGNKVQYDKYLNDIYKNKQQVMVHQTAQEIYYEQSIISGKQEEVEKLTPVQHDENITVVYWKIPRVS